MFWVLAVISLSLAAAPTALKPIAAKGKAPVKAAAKTPAKVQGKAAVRVQAKAPAKAPGRGPAKVVAGKSTGRPAVTPAKPGLAARGGRVQQQPTLYSRYSNTSRNKRQLVSSRPGMRPKPVYHPTPAVPSADRYKEIQSALAQKGYLRSEATGAWDAESIDAMKRFQKDQNLDADGKLSSLSIIALGLGPKRTLTASTPASPAPPKP